MELFDVNTLLIFYSLLKEQDVYVRWSNEHVICFSILYQMYLLTSIFKLLLTIVKEKSMKNICFEDW